MKMWKDFYFHNRANDPSGWILSGLSQVVKFNWLYQVLQL